MNIQRQMQVVSTPAYRPNDQAIGTPQALPAYYVSAHDTPRIGTWRHYRDMYPAWAADNGVTPVEQMRGGLSVLGWHMAEVVAADGLYRLALTLGSNDRPLFVEIFTPNNPAMPQTVHIVDDGRLDAYNPVGLMNAMAQVQITAAEQIRHRKAWRLHMPVLHRSDVNA